MRNIANLSENWLEKKKKAQGRGLNCINLTFVF